MGSIKINSSVTREFAPDQVKFDIHIHKVAENSKELTIYNKSVVDELIEGMRDLNISEENIKEDRFSIAINREYEDGKSEDRGYKLMSEYSIIDYIDYELIDGVRDLLNELGLEFNITYGLEDENEIRDTLLQEAVKKSRAKAHVIASAADMEVGEMKEVKYCDVVSAHVPMMLRANAPVHEDAAPHNIELTESVEVEWELL